MLGRNCAEGLRILLTADQDDNHNNDDDGHQGSGRESNGIGRAVARGTGVGSVLRSDAAGLALPRIVRGQREICRSLRHGGML